MEDSHQDDPQPRQDIILRPLSAITGLPGGGSRSLEEMVHRALVFVTRSTNLEALGSASCEDPHFTGDSFRESHSPAFVEKQKQRLLDLHDQLTHTVIEMGRDTVCRAPSGSDESSSAIYQGGSSDLYDRDLALTFLAKEGEDDALYEITQALLRIDKGVYGICEISGKKIDQRRLEVIPFARLTIECQLEWEREHGNRRFRPNN